MLIGPDSSTIAASGPPPRCRAVGRRPAAPARSRGREPRSLSQVRLERRAAVRLPGSARAVGRAFGSQCTSVLVVREPQVRRRSSSASSPRASGSEGSSAPDLVRAVAPGSAGLVRRPADRPHPPARTPRRTRVARTTRSRTTPSGSDSQAGSQTRATAGQPMICVEHADRRAVPVPGRRPGRPGRTVQQHRQRRHVAAPGRGHGQVDPEVRQPDLGLHRAAGRPQGGRDLLGVPVDGHLAADPLRHAVLRLLQIGPQVLDADRRRLLGPQVLRLERARTPSPDGGPGSPPRSAAARRPERFSGPKFSGSTAVRVRPRSRWRR